MGILTSRQSANMLFRRLEAVKNAPSISWAVHEITSCFGYQKSPPLIAKGLKNILSNTHLIISLGMSAACLPSSHCGLSGVALRRVTVAIGLYSVRLSEGSGPASLVCCGICPARNTARILLPSALRLFGGRIT